MFFMKSKKEKQFDLEREYFGKIYDVLILHAGASSRKREDKGNIIDWEKENFISSHLSISEFSKDTYVCKEWRFCGLLGFGGKYWSGRNKVDCYREDENKETLKIIEITNEELKKVYEEMKVNGLELEINAY